VVPVVDLSRRTRRYLDAFQSATHRVLSSGRLLLGPECEALERELAVWAGSRHAVAVSSGAAALQLGMRAVGVGPGDEVIVPDFTAVPTASAVCALRATPVPVDVDRRSAAMDLDAARAAVTERTKALVPVHLYGRPAPIPDIGVPVIEDAAQAHGALCGVTGRAAAYSFYPTKNVGGVGDGGAVVTDDDEVAETVRRLRVHGMTHDYEHPQVSQNFRMSELEAAWLRLVLADVGADNVRRRAIVAAYRAAGPDLVWHSDHATHVHHLAVVRLPDREVARRCLAAHGVATAVHYPLTISQQPAYRCYARTDCPEARAWAATCTTLPCFPELTDDEVATVCRALERL
jgi:dTDP-4-amino-4,6-dideoxygalactose transaminase